MTFKHYLTSFALLSLSAPAFAHDAWVEVNTPLTRTGETVAVDLKLGNHDNNARDFKLHGLLTLDWTECDAVGPDGARVSLKDRLTTAAAEEKQGYWTGSFVPEAPGAYCVVQSLDRVMQHGKSVRGVRTAKTWLLAADSLDAPGAVAADEPLGLPIELVFVEGTFADVAVGRPLTVQLLKGGKPLPDVVVSFIPQGATLAEEFDATDERKTDAEGRASYTPTESRLHLVVAHFTDETEQTAEYEFASYATTLTVRVPNRAIAR